MLTTTKLKLSAGTKTLCKQLDWQVQQGERWGVLGLNGAGKTTLLHTLAGIHEPDSGEIRLYDKNLATWKRRAVARHVGLLLQENYEPFPGKVLDYVLIGRHPHLHAWQWESDKDIQLAQDALHTVGLRGFETRDIASLSGGEHQRMAIAAILVQQPDIFLLDEPVNHLDWHHQHQLLKNICDRVTTQSKALVMVIHDVNLAARYCDHVLMIFDNGEIQSGTTDQMLHPEMLARLYGYPVAEINTDAGPVYIPG